MERDTIYDLKLSLEIEKKILNNANRVKERLLQMYAPKGYSTGTSYIDADNIRSTNNQMDLCELVAQIHQCDSMIFLQEERIKKLQKDIDEIYQMIRSMNGLNKKVHYLRLVEGKSLKEIADELGYSYGYIRNF